MGDFQKFNDTFALQALDLISAISNHNDNFSSLRLAMRGLASSIMRDDKPSTSGIDETSSSMTALEQLSESHRSILLHLGLEITPITGSLRTGTNEESKDITNTARISFFEPKKLISFLATLPEEATQRDDINNLVNELANSVASHLCSKEFVLDEDDSKASFVNDFREALKHFKRLNVEGRTLNKIEFYIDKFNESVLLQAILVQNEGLLLEPGDGFGPADWPKDMAEDVFEERWKQALNKVSELSNNENEIAFREEVALHLLKCCQISLQWIESNKESECYNMNPTKARLLSDILINATKELKTYV